MVGVVGVFNLQGSSWDRTRRKFYIHDKRVGTLSGDVKPWDVETLRGLPSSSTASRGSSSAGNAGGSSASDNGVEGAQALSVASPPKGSFAAYFWGKGEMKILQGEDTVPVSLPAGGSEMCWFSPVLQQSGVSFAPLGLTGMYNGGGAVLSCSISDAQEARRSLKGAVQGVNGSSSSSSQPGPSPQSSTSSSVAAVLDSINSNGSGSGPSAVASLQLKGCGNLLMYSSQQPSHVWVNLTPWNYKYNGFTGELELELPHTDKLRCEVQVIY